MKRIQKFFFSFACSMLIGFIFLSISAIAFAQTCPDFLSSQPSQKNFSLRFNTSNPNKQNDYKMIFMEFGRPIEISESDLPEIDSHPIDVIVHKSSQFTQENEIVLVEDTSLDVEGTNIGVHIRWFVHQLDSFIGKKALLRMLLGYRLKNSVYVFSYEAEGRIATPVIPGKNLNSYFMPTSSHQTLAESQDLYQMRKTLVHRFLRHENPTIRPVIEHWDQAWQPHP